jgi:hypothetical protein
MHDKRLSVVFSVFWLLPAAVLFACTALADDTESKPEVSGPVPSFTHRSRAKQLEDNVYLEVDYPEFGIDFLDKAIMETVQSFAMSHGGFEDFHVAKDDEGRIIPSEHAMGYDLHAPRAGILSIVFYVWDYGGGISHWFPSARTYDLCAKKQLRLGDVLPHLETVKNKLIQALKKSVDDFDKSCPHVEFHISADETNFYLDKDSLVLPSGGLPSWQWGECSSLSVDIAILKGIGADMRYWEKERCRKNFREHSKAKNAPPGKR